MINEAYQFNLSWCEVDESTRENHRRVKFEEAWKTIIKIRERMLEIILSCIQLRV